MKKRFNLFILLGALLIFAGLGAMVLTQNSAEKNRISATETAEKIMAVLPPATEGIEGMYSFSEMPAMSVDGTDYIALLKAEKYGVKMPIANRWSKNSAEKHPCRFTGSCYDGSMVIGAGEVHFAFLAQLDIGDKITLTDMLGAEFNYTVEKIFRSDSAESEKLTAGDYPLVLFTFNSKENKYIIVNCG